MKVPFCRFCRRSGWQATLLGSCEHWRTSFTGSWRLVTFSEAPDCQACDDDSLAAACLNRFVQSSRPHLADFGRVLWLQCLSQASKSASCWVVGQASIGFKFFPVTGYLGRVVAAVALILSYPWGVFMDLV